MPRRSAIAPAGELSDWVLQLSDGQYDFTSVFLTPGMDPELPETDSESVRYVFGAGFVFGVVTATLVLVGVLATATESSALNLLFQPLLLSVGAAILVAVLVGSGLFLLAFPENRVRVPVVRGDLTDERE